MKNLNGLRLYNGITLLNNCVIAIKRNDSHQYWSGNKLQLGEIVKTPIGDIQVIMYQDTTIGILLRSKYTLTESRSLNHSTVFHMTTSHNESIFTNNIVSIHCCDDSLIVTMSPDYSLENDSRRFDENNDE